MSFNITALRNVLSSLCTVYVFRKFEQIGRLSLYSFTVRFMTQWLLIANCIIINTEVKASYLATAPRHGKGKYLLLRCKFCIYQTLSCQAAIDLALWPLANVGTTSGENAGVVAELFSLSRIMYGCRLLCCVPLFVVVVVASMSIAIDGCTCWPSLVATVWRLVESSNLLVGDVASMEL